MDTHPLENLSELYLKSQKFSLSTIKSYRISYKFFIRFLKEHNILYAKTSDIIRYREEKRLLGHSTFYIHIHMCALRSLYAYLRLNQVSLNLPDAYAYDLMKPIQNEKIKNQLRKRVLSMEEAKHMILITKNNRKYIYDYRNHAIIYLMLTVGIRRDEIIRLKREDYMVSNEIAYLTIRKFGKFNDQTIRISRGGKIALDDYLNKRKDDHMYLFISHRQVSKYGLLSHTFFMTMFRRVLEDCGFDPRVITPHALRHTAGLINLLRGGSIESTQKLLRHQEIASTMIYQDYIDKMNDRSEELLDAFILKEDGILTYEAWITYIES